MREAEGAVESEVGLLDLLLVVAENLRLLVFGALFFGLLGWGVAYLLPQRYMSEAILALPAQPVSPRNMRFISVLPTPAQAVTTMVSPSVLDPVIKTLKLANGNSVQAIRVALARNITVSVGIRDNLIRLEVVAESPEQAQIIANSVIDTWLLSTVPGEHDRLDLEKNQAYAKASLDSVTRLLDRLGSEDVANLNKPLSRGEAGMPLLGLGELQAQYVNEVLGISRELRGLSRDVVKQAPTLPTEPAWPKRLWFGVFAGAGAGFVLLLWSFLRFAWVKSSRDPAVAQKQARLRAVVGLRRD